jgi:hypothetical protein
MADAEFTPVQPFSKLRAFDNDGKPRHSKQAAFGTPNLFTGINVGFEFSPDLAFSGARGVERSARSQVYHEIDG